MEHAIVFFLAGFVGFMQAYGATVPSSILLLVLLIGGVYFAGWFALLTVLFGMVFGNVLAKSR